MKSVRRQVKDRRRGWIEDQIYYQVRNQINDQDLDQVIQVLDKVWNKARIEP